MFSPVQSREAQLLLSCIQKKKQVWTLSITKGVWPCRRGDFCREGSHSLTDQTQAPALLCLPEHNLHLLGEPQGFTGKEEPSEKGRGVNRLNTLSQKCISETGLVISLKQQNI